MEIALEKLFWKRGHSKTIYFLVETSKNIVTFHPNYIVVVGLFRDSWNMLNTDT